MKQKYVVASAWGRIDEQTGEATVKAVLTAVIADSEGDAVSQTLALGLKDPDMAGRTMDSWSVRPLLSLI